MRLSPEIVLPTLIASPDPENFEWNPFDDEYRAKLDKRDYISPSHDQKHGPLPVDPNGTTSLTAQSSDSNVPQTTKDTAQKFDDEKDLEFDEVPSDDEDAEIPEGSLFDYQIPGVLTKDEVDGLDLHQWRLVVRNSLIDLEV